MPFLRKTLFVVLGLALVGSTLPAGAEDSPGIRRVGLAGGTIHLSRDLEARSPVRSAALRVLRFGAEELGIDSSGFKVEEVERSISGLHVRGRQYRAGIPVDGTNFAVHFVDGEAVQVDAYTTDLAGEPTSNPIAEEDAVASALRSLGVAETLVPSRAHRMLTESNSRLNDVWRISVLSASPPVNATVDVSASDGRIIRTIDDSQYVDGSATLFNPNPIVTLKDSSVRQPGEEQGADTDLDSPELTKARVTLPLKDLNDEELAAGRLSGPWVNVYSGGNNSVDGNFNYTRSDSRFEAGMAYAHVDKVQRYFRSLGFTKKKSVNAEPQDVIAVPVPGFDNSFYQPGNDVMLLGSGGVDDGEDAEVIIHEYGHAVQDAQVPGWGEKADGGAMGEGFGDFLAAAFYARKISKGFQDACVADWDATSYSSDEPPCLRRVDGNKHYPEDLDENREVHADGEIWSAFLWDIRKKLGNTQRARSDRSIKLVLASHEYLTPQANFRKAVVALRTAAKALGHKGWSRKVKRAAIKRGFPYRPKKKN